MKIRSLEGQVVGQNITIQSQQKEIEKLNYDLTRTSNGLKYSYGEFLTFISAFCLSFIEHFFNFFHEKLVICFTFMWQAGLVCVLKMVKMVGLTLSSKKCEPLVFCVNSFFTAHCKCLSSLGADFNILTPTCKIFFEKYSFYLSNFKMKAIFV